MTEINETRLPGIGIQHDFACLGGTRVGVITRHSGRRELVIYDRRDPDSVANSLELSADESRTLGEILGGSPVVAQLEKVVNEVEGLSIDWLPLPQTFEPRTIGATEMRTHTGASVIAVNRGDQPIPAPGPDFELLPGDVVVLAGTPEGVAKAAEIFGG